MSLSVGERRKEIRIPLVSGYEMQVKLTRQKFSYINVPVEATRGYFGTGPLNFEPRSDERRHEPAPSPNFRTTPTEDVCPLLYLACSSPYTHGSSEESVSET
ncbi:hypothetical protein AVEN_112858-1 [Araneus ventricosus]|uniref:Uncharacterized protein n=1 Tax=Araneus ventricosus TaxID=182803 RepID=A0A4Y2HTM1_ARAVE|nr:hypothetical protein AVEN_112858-1 [Araneus ventricosus]